MVPDASDWECLRRLPQMILIIVLMHITDGQT